MCSGTALLSKFVRPLLSSIWRRREPDRNKFHTMFLCFKIYFESLFRGIHWTFFKLSKIALKKNYIDGFLSIETYRVAFTCSKLTKETPEQYMKSIQSLQQMHQKDVSDIVLTSLLLTLNRFYTLFWCSHCWLCTSKCWLEYLGPSHISVIEFFCDNS